MEASAKTNLNTIIKDGVAILILDKLKNRIGGTFHNDKS